MSKKLLQKIKTLKGKRRIDAVVHDIPLVKNINKICLGVTMLIQAVLHEDDANNVSIIKILVENGADPHTTDSQSKIALDYALDYPSNHLTIKLLLDYHKAEHFNTLEYLLRYIIGKNKVEMSWKPYINYILEMTKNLPPNILYYFVQLQHADDLALLLSLIELDVFAPVDPNEIFIQAMINPRLTCAVMDSLLQKYIGVSALPLKNIFNDNLWNSEPQIITAKIKLLLDYGFDILLINNDNIMKFIEKSHNDDYLEIIKILLKKRPLDPLYLTKAMSNNNPLIVKFLLKAGIEYSNKFIQQLTFSDSSHYGIWDLVQEIELGKKCMNKIALVYLKDLHHEFVMSPNSILSKVVAIRWHLAQENALKVYSKLKLEDKFILDYLGVNDADDMVWKIEQHLKYI